MKESYDSTRHLTKKECDHEISQILGYINEKYKDHVITHFSLSERDMISEYFGLPEMSTHKIEEIQDFATPVPYLKDMIIEMGPIKFTATPFMDAFGLPLKHKSMSPDTAQVEKDRLFELKLEIDTDFLAPFLEKTDKISHAIRGIFAYRLPKAGMIVSLEEAHTIIVRFSIALLKLRYYKMNWLSYRIRSKMIDVYTFCEVVNSNAERERRERTSPMDSFFPETSIPSGA